MSGRRLRLAGAAIAIAIFALPAAANFLVLDARGEGVAKQYPIGSDAGLIELGQAESVVVMDGVALRTLTGPGAFRPESETNVAEGLSERLKRILPAPGEESEKIGAVRGGNADVTEDHQLIDVQSSGPKCVDSLTGIQLWRPDSASRVRASIQPKSGRRKHFFTWAANDHVEMWPRRLSPSFGETYLLSISGATPREIVLIEVDLDAPAGHVLRQLVEAGCSGQARALIKSR